MKIRHGVFTYSLGRLTFSEQPEQIVIDMILSFAVESVVDVVAKLWHVEAKEVADEAFRRYPFLRSTNRGVWTLNAEAITMGWLMALAFSPCASLEQS